MLKKIFSIKYTSILIKGYKPTIKEIKYNKCNSSENCYIQDYYGREKNIHYFYKKLLNGIKEVIVVKNSKIIHILLLNDYLVYLQEYEKLINIKSIKDIIKNFDENLNDYNMLIKDSKENIIIIAKCMSENLPTTIQRTINNLYLNKSLKIKKDNLNKYTICDDFGLYEQDFNENKLEIIYGNLYKRKDINIQSVYSNNYDMFRHVNNPENCHKVNLSFIYSPNDIFFENPCLIEISFNNLNTYYLVIFERKILKYNKDDKKYNKADEYEYEYEYNIFDEDYIFGNHESDHYEYQKYALIFKKYNEKNDNLIHLKKEMIYNDVENYKIMYKSKNFKHLEISNIIEKLLNKDSYFQEKWIDEIYKTSLTIEKRQLLEVSDAGELNENEIQVAKMFYYTE